jgi:hypothetical protein
LPVSSDRDGALNRETEIRDAGLGPELLHAGTGTGIALSSVGRMKERVQSRFSGGLSIGPSDAGTM